MKSVRIFQSQKGKQWFHECEKVPFKKDTLGKEMRLLLVYSDITYQQITGFGGAFTQASARNYALMPQSEKERLLDAYFSKEGLDYTLGRIPIGSCDFSDGNRSYCDKADDTELESFSIDCDEQELLPFLRAAVCRRNHSIRLMASPWSPPAWMKTNNNMLHGGSLKRECYTAWAQYLVKYLKAYRDKGMEISWITVQNEPKAVQRWESCIYTAEEEKAFVRDSLAPALKGTDLDTKIIIWDHNKERVFTRAREIFSDETARKAVAGIAFHWYSGDHFANLRLCREVFPDKELFFTEGCVELSGVTTMSEKAVKGVSEVSSAPWEFGECYAHDMIGNFNAGMSAFLDWNLVLNEQGGPNHVKNYCSAPVIYDRNKQKLILQPSYCFIGHFSKFVKNGSRLSAHSCFTDKLEVCSFTATDGMVTVVVLNEQEYAIPFILKDVVSDEIAEISAPPRSITTLCY